MKIFPLFIVSFIVSFIFTITFVPPVYLNGLIELQHLFGVIIIFTPVFAIQKISLFKRFFLYIFLVLCIFTWRLQGSYNHINGLPVKFGMSIDEVRKILKKEGKPLGNKGGLARIDNYPYSSKKISNFCEYYPWERGSYLVVYYDNKQQVEHLFTIGTE
jgi:hypothetical protein